MESTEEKLDALWKRGKSSGGYRVRRIPHMATFGPISHISGPKLAFWGNFIFVRCRVSAQKTQEHVKTIKKCCFGLQTAFFDSFNVLLNCLTEKWYRTNMKLPQKASFGPEACEILPKVWFLASGFCLLRLGEPLGGSRGNPAGLSIVPAL